MDNNNDNDDKLRVSAYGNLAYIVTGPRNLAKQITCLRGYKKKATKTYPYNNPITQSKSKIKIKLGN